MRLEKRQFRLFYFGFFSLYSLSRDFLHHNFLKVNPRLCRGLLEFDISGMLQLWPGGKELLGKKHRPGWPSSWRLRPASAGYGGPIGRYPIRNSECGIRNSLLLFPFRIPQSAFRILVARLVHEMEAASWFLPRRSLPPGLRTLSLYYQGYFRDTRRANVGRQKRGWKFFGKKEGVAESIFGHPGITPSRLGHFAKAAKKVPSSRLRRSKRESLSFALEITSTACFVEFTGWRFTLKRMSPGRTPARSAGLPG